MHMMYMYCRFTYYCKERTTYPVAPEDEARLTCSIKAIAADCSKRDKNNKRETDSSKEALIADEKWVELDEVKTVLQELYASMVSLRTNPIYDKRNHNMLIDFMIVHWYYNAPQGRIGAFPHLTKQDALTLCEHSKYLDMHISLYYMLIML